MKMQTNNYSEVQRKLTEGWTVTKEEKMILPHN